MERVFATDVMSGSLPALLGRHCPTFGVEVAGDIEISGQYRTTVAARLHRSKEVIQMPIEIPQATMDKLNRLGVLDALIYADRADEPELKECWKLRDELTSEFFPLVQLIVRSGLLTICAENEENAAGEYLSPEQKLVAWDADHAFLNGNIWIQGGEVTMSMPKQKPCSPK
jgi:hypothetical protein